MKKLATKNTVFVPIDTLVHVIRGQKVMLDSDLAKIYAVETRVINQAVKRNPERFPMDFMFQLTLDEASFRRSQTVIASGRNIKYQPLAFTEQGIAMLSSVLRSPRAVQMNIVIMRAFVRMRELIATNKEFAVRIEKLEHNHQRTGDVIEMIVEDIEKLNKDINWIKNPPVKRKHPIGFVIHKGDA